MLLLLYSSSESGVLVEDLCECVEYSNLGVSKAKSFRPCTKSLVEHDKDTDSVFLSPKGATFVEQNLL